MLAVMRIRGIALWREDYIWAYYSGVLLLFLGRFVFSLTDLLNLVPLYGLFATNLALIVLDQHRRHGMEAMAKLTERHPLRRTGSDLLFALLCASPAGLLLFAFAREAFPGTPAYLLAAVTAEFIAFAVCLAFALSLLQFKYATLISLLFYFALLVVNGYRLEYMPFLAPTLNFMYPDYPDGWNMAAIFLLSLTLLALYLWKKFDRSRRSRARTRTALVVVAAAYVLVPVVQGTLEHRAAAGPYSIMQAEGMTVSYKGLPERQALRYAQVVADVSAAAGEEAGPAARGIAVNEIRITRRTGIPSGSGVEHIVRLDGGVLHIEPYSNKFYEFNYGYNIVRDLTDLLVADPQAGSRVAAAVRQDDERGFFRATKLRAGSE